MKKKAERTGRLAIEEINLLERQSLSLGDEEVGEDEAADAGSTPDKEDLDTKIGSFDTVRAEGSFIDEVGCGVANAEIPKPVRGDRKRHALGTDTERLKGR